MADNSNSRKKALIISVLAFLFAGGGIFLFFVVQGANDVIGTGKKNSFSYGFAVREAVLPLFKRMGFSTVEDEMIVATAERMKARGIEPVSEITSEPADVSDWMAQAPSGAPSASARSGAPARVPRMAGRAASPVGGASGGGSKSAGGVTRFGPGSSSGMTSVSGKGQAGSPGNTEKGTLSALKTSRAMLGEGLRSNSAMTASNKWNQSFGVGSGSGSGSGGGSLAYNKTGLVALDKIKSGEISNLKLDKKGGLKTTDVNPPAKDEDGTAAALSKDKDYKKAQDDAIKKQAAEAALKEAEAAITKPKGKEGEDAPQAKSDPDKPPDAVTNLAANSQPPEGKYCPSGCETKGGDTYKDNEPEYKKEGDVWTVTYTGEQCSPAGDCFNYSDTMAVLPGSNPPIQPLSSVCDGKPCSNFGGAPSGGS